MSKRDDELVEKVRELVRERDRYRGLWERASSERDWAMNELMRLNAANMEEENRILQDQLDRETDRRIAETSELRRELGTVGNRLGEARKRIHELEVRLRVKDAEVSRLSRAVECLTANVDKPCKRIGPDPEFKGCNDSCVPHWYHVSEVEDAQMRAAMHATDRIRELEAEVQRLRSERSKLQRERDLLTRDAAELNAMGKKLERKDARIQKLEAELAEEKKWRERFERAVRALVDYAGQRSTSASANGDRVVSKAYGDMEIRLRDVLRLDDYSDPDAILATLTE